MRKALSVAALVIALSILVAIPAMAAPRLHSDKIYIDVGFAAWPTAPVIDTTSGQLVPGASIYGGYIDLYFPFDMDMNLFVWFKALNSDGVSSIQATTEIGLQVGFNPYLALYCGAIYGFNSDLFQAVDPEVGLLARLPLGDSVNWIFRAGASYYFDPLGMEFDNFTFHYGTFVTVDTSGWLTFNVGLNGYIVPGSGFTTPILQGGLGVKF